MKLSTGDQIHTETRIKPLFIVSRQCIQEYSKPVEAIIKEVEAEDS